MSIRYTPEELADALRLYHPTEEQRRIIVAPQAPSLVVAGAGSGKTETMATRVVYLVTNGLVSPHRVLGLTFTRKAAAELRERVLSRLRQLEEQKLWAPRDNDRILGFEPQVSTYNSYAANLVSQYGYRIGLNPDTVLIGEGRRWMIVDQIVRSLPYDAEDNPFGDAALSTITKAVLSLDSSLGDHGVDADTARAHLNQLVDAMNPDGLRAKAREVAGRVSVRAYLMKIVNEYHKFKRENSLIDFSDQVALAAQIVKEHPDVVRVERESFDDIVLDEFQDTSVVQLDLLAALFADRKSVV